MNLQEFIAHKLKVLKLLLLVSDGLEAHEKGSMITTLKHLIFWFQLVPASPKPLEICSVGINTTSSITPHYCHLRVKQTEKEITAVNGLKHERKKTNCPSTEMEIFLNIDPAYVYLWFYVTCSLIMSWWLSMTSSSLSHLALREESESRPAPATARSKRFFSSAYWNWGRIYTHTYSIAGC